MAICNHTPECSWIPIPDQRILFYCNFCICDLQAENLITHRDEIFSRPKRTWFVTEKEKKLVANAGKVIFNISVYI